MAHKSISSRLPKTHLLNIYIGGLLLLLLTFLFISFCRLPISRYSYFATGSHHIQSSPYAAYFSISLLLLHEPTCNSRLLSFFFMCSWLFHPTSTISPNPPSTAPHLPRTIAHKFTKIHNHTLPRSTQVKKKTLLNYCPWSCHKCSTRSLRSWSCASRSSILRCTSRNLLIRFSSFSGTTSVPQTPNHIH